MSQNVTVSKRNSGAKYKRHMYSIWRQVVGISQHLLT
jgi:hypothetical protein